MTPALTEPTTLCYELSGLQIGVKYDVTVVAGSLHLLWGVEPALPVTVTPIATPTETPADPQLVSQVRNVLKTADTLCGEKLKHKPCVWQDETSGVFTWTPPMNAATSPTYSYLVSLKKFGDTQFFSSGSAVPVYTDQEVGYRISGLETGIGYTVQVLSQHCMHIYSGFGNEAYLFPSTPPNNFRFMQSIWLGRVTPHLSLFSQSQSLHCPWIL